MNASEYLLTCLAEECAEIGEQAARIAIRASKALRFGPDEIGPDQLRTNFERLADDPTPRVVLEAWWPSGV
jgi:hypothetical protein